MPEGSKITSYIIRCQSKTGHNYYTYYAIDYTKAPHQPPKYNLINCKTKDDAFNKTKIFGYPEYQSHGIAKPNYEEAYQMAKEALKLCENKDSTLIKRTMSKGHLEDSEDVVTFSNKSVLQQFSERLNMINFASDEFEKVKAKVEKLLDTNGYKVSPKRRNKNSICYRIPCGLEKQEKSWRKVVDKLPDFETDEVYVSWFNQGFKTTNIVIGKKVISNDISNDTNVSDLVNECLKYYDKHGEYNDSLVERLPFKTTNKLITSRMINSRNIIVDFDIVVFEPLDKVIAVIDEKVRFKPGISKEVAEKVYKIVKKKSYDVINGYTYVR